MSLTYEPFDTITVSKVNEKLGGGVEKLNQELSDLETKIPKSINENLLVNGYLVNPVRTFGLTSQTISNAIQSVFNGWTIAGSARFLFSSALGYVNVTSTADGTEFYNVTGSISVIKGKTYTFSMLVSDDYNGVKIVSTFTNTASTSTNYDNGIYTLTFVAENNTGYVGISIPNGTGISIYGAKLEEGSTQTLCYKDSSGNWVQHIPNKADELARCSQWNTINKYIGNALLPLSGGTMTGSINMGNQKITKLADGTNDTDAVNLGQLNKLASGRVKIYTVAITGNTTQLFHNATTDTYYYLYTGSAMFTDSTDIKSFISGNLANPNQRQIELTPIQIRDISFNTIAISFITTQSYDSAEAIPVYLYAIE